MDNDDWDAPDGDYEFRRSKKIMKSDKEKYIHAEVEFRVATGDAVLIAFDGEEEWVPRTCLSWTCDKKIETLARYDEFQIEVAEWKAIQIGLV